MSVPASAVPSARSRLAPIAIRVFIIMNPYGRYVIRRSDEQRTLGAARAIGHLDQRTLGTARAVGHLDQRTSGTGRGGGHLDERAHGDARARGHVGRRVVGMA